MTAAVVIGASGGIGAAMVEALQEEGAFDRVFGFARSFAGVDRIDLEDEAGIAAAAARVAGDPPSLVVVATGLLHEGASGPEKNLRDLDPAWLARQFAVNTIGPVLVAKHFLPVMPAKGARSVFAVLSARVGSITDNRLGGWYGYRASKAALNQLVRTLAIENRRRSERGLVVGLHPGTVDTALSRPFQSSGRDLFTPGRAAVQLLDVIDGLKPADSGKVFDWEGTEVAP